MTTSNPPEPSPGSEQSTPHGDYLLVLRDLGAALHSTRRRASKWRAWQQLCRVDPYGIESFLAYTPDVFSLLAEAIALDRYDCDAIHHLAIAHHARAWDLELAGDWAAAAVEWKQALYYWKELQACGPFWRALAARGSTLPGFDPQCIEELRRDLLDGLLDIHIEFIHHYAEQQQFDHAARHVELIQHARLPPAARRRMDTLIYEAMCAVVPKLRAERRYLDVLQTLDACLRFIPTYEPALLEYLDIGREWASQMSSTEPWDTLEQLASLLSPRWRTCAEHAADSRIRNALAESAAELGNKYWIRACRLLEEDQENEHVSVPSLDDEVYVACERAVEWLERVMLHDAEHTMGQSDLINALFCRAVLRRNRAAALPSIDDALLFLEASINDCNRAIQLAQEAQIQQDAISRIEAFKEECCAFRQQFPS